MHISILFAGQELNNIRMIHEGDNVQNIMRDPTLRMSRTESMFHSKWLAIK